LSIQQIKTYPAFKRSEKSLIKSGLNADSIDIDGWHLPGQKEKRDFCGQWSYMGCLKKEKHSNGKIFLKPFEKSCFRADCVKCCFKWLGREASKATKRMEKYEKQSKKTLKHIIVSVPRFDYYKEKKTLSKKVRKILKEVKADSGLIIFHPFRIDKKTDVWYYSPHFHVLGFGWVEGVAEAYNKYGYVIKNLGKRESVFGTIYYQLSHAGIKKHNHVLSYFGECSYSKLKVDQENEDLKNCPFCKDSLQELEFNPNCELKPDPLIMTLEYMRDFYQWFLKAPYQKI